MKGCQQDGKSSNYERCKKGRERPQSRTSQNNRTSFRRVSLKSREQQEVHNSRIHFGALRLRNFYNPPVFAVRVIATQKWRLGILPRTSQPSQQVRKTGFTSKAVNRKKSSNLQKKIENLRDHLGELKIITGNFFSETFTVLFNFSNFFSKYFEMQCKKKRENKTNPDLLQILATAR